MPCLFSSALVHTCRPCKRVDMVWSLTSYPHVLHLPFLFVPQYSQKEDKYEEEIKVLTDKLKEVKFCTALIWSPCSFKQVLHHVNLSL